MTQSQPPQWNQINQPSNVHQFGTMNQPQTQSQSPQWNQISQSQSPSHFGQMSQPQIQSQTPQWNQTTHSQILATNDTTLIKTSLSDPWGTNYSVTPSNQPSNAPQWDQISSTQSNPQSSSEDFGVSNAEYGEYSREYSRLPKDGRGMLKFEQLSVHLNSLNVQQIVISPICELAAVRGEGILCAEEFVVARILAERVRRGQTLPISLPNSLRALVPHKLPTNDSDQLKREIAQVLYDIKTARELSQQIMAQRMEIEREVQFLLQEDERLRLDLSNQGRGNSCTFELQQISATAEQINSLQKTISHTRTEITQLRQKVILEKNNKESRSLSNVPKKAEISRKLEAVSSDCPNWNNDIWGTMDWPTGQQTTIEQTKIPWTMAENNQQPGFELAASGQTMNWPAEAVTGQTMDWPAGIEVAASGQTMNWPAEAVTGQTMDWPVTEQSGQVPWSMGEYSQDLTVVEQPQLEETKEIEILVKATMSFKGTKSNHLSFSKGDTFQLVDKSSEESPWWIGRIGQQIGWFPKSHVSFQPNIPPEKPTISFESVYPPNSVFCVAVFRFECAEEGDLEFNVGDVIRVLSELDDDWSEGELSGQIGIFPNNYVQPILVEQASESATVTTAHSSPCVSHLTLECGDSVLILARGGLLCWGHGVPSVSCGWFPLSCLKCTD